MRRTLSIVILSLCVVTMLFAKASSTVGATANFLAPTLNNAASSFGVNGDGGGSYFNGNGGVQSYFGAGGKDYDLVTYSTSRFLTITGSSSQAQIWSNAGLALTGGYQVDFYGVNFYGAYSSMSPGTTAQVHGVLQFHVQQSTYQLDYQSLAVMRDTTNGKYHFTSDAASLPGYPGFTASPQAMLSLVRKSGNINYGTVTLPVRFDVQ